MHRVFITGGNGFIGKNVIKHLGSSFSFYKYQRNESIHIDHDIVLHFAGKAHDTNNVSTTSEYYESNYILTKNIFDAFLESKAKTLIVLSSIKAVCDYSVHPVSEEDSPCPTTVYGKSKLLADQYVLSNIPKDKKVFILRPSMIHGPGNKGNLNLLYKMMNKGLPWPLGAFENKRSYCSLENLFFVLKELILRSESISSGVYNLADDEPLSTNEVIILMAKSLHKNPKILRVPRWIMKFIAKTGDFFNLPLNSEVLGKLTETYILDNSKLLTAINKPLPVRSEDGMMHTLNSFKNEV